MFATIRHEILRGNTCLLKKEQDLVYRERTPAGGHARRAPHAADAIRIVSPDSRLLFRHSALMARPGMGIAVRKPSHCPVRTAMDDEMTLILLGAAFAAILPNLLVASYDWLSSTRKGIL